MDYIFGSPGYLGIHQVRSIAKGPHIRAQDDKISSVISSQAKGSL